MKLLARAGVVAGRTERVAHVADELEAGELVDQREALSATFVVLGERAAGRAPMKEVGRDRDMPMAATCSATSRWTSVSPNSSPRTTAVGRAWSSLRPGQKRWHRSPVERCDADLRVGMRHRRYLTYARDDC